MGARYICVALGLVVGNYAYQLFRATPDLLVAGERSFFQVMAVLMVAVFG